MFCHFDLICFFFLQVRLVDLTAHSQGIVSLEFLDARKQTIKTLLSSERLLQKKLFRYNRLHYSSQHTFGPTLFFLVAYCTYILSGGLFVHVTWFRWRTSGGCCHRTNLTSNVFFFNHTTSVAHIATDKTVIPPVIQML